MRHLACMEWHSMLPQMQVHGIVKHWLRLAVTASPRVRYGTCHCQTQTEYDDACWTLLARHLLAGL